MGTADVIVVGGGAVGCAAAFELTREGLRVVLLERDDLASQASGAAAGMLLPAGEAGGHGPFLTWGVRSLGLFPELVAELRERSGVDPEYEACGALYVATSQRQAAALRARGAELPELEFEWLEAEAARDAEPQLAPDLAGVLWSPREANVRSPLLTRAFAGAAIQLGARIETGVAALGLLRDGSRVTGVRTTAGDWSGAHVVACMGSWASACATWLDAPFQLPIEPVRGQIVSLESRSPLRSMIASDESYLVPKRDGSVVVGSTEERAGFDCRVTAEGIRRLLDAAPRAVPSLANATFRSAWAGLRPATPDELPLIGPFPGVEGLLLAAGHYRNGVLLSPVTARLLGGLVLGKGLPPDAALFLPERVLRPARKGAAG
jgi:glycine oxidase